MDNKTEIREFLSTRRARVTPEQVGLPTFGGNRRVKGLRREEVALLAGVSVDYYVRLERGNLGGVSEGVLEAISRALQLDDVERMHLFDLSRTANASIGTRRRAVTTTIRSSVQRMLDSFSGPAWVRNDRMDILGANVMARALYAPVFADPARRPNTARFTFLDAGAPDFYVDWSDVTHDSVAILRAAAGRNPYDKALSDLIGELSTRSELFRQAWASHDVGMHRSGVKRMRHPEVGDLELTYEAMELVMDPGLTVLTYSAEPASPSEEKLRLLAVWAATEALAEPSV
ncbi:helix-turn-helix transcriptional regulator [Frondihabitans australicus]|uniref:helix-turn-helix transcriptional regulator n=1 Tax=Frondihabitans australicus TaxID=386892 RepID=UPI000EAEE88B|nr:helix-turn-helix transcriptional regulator [Frondihabitans australicus]